MGQKENSIREALEKFTAGSREIGRQFLDKFSQTALNSKIPAEFYQAEQNYGRATIRIIPGSDEELPGTRRIVKHLLGIDCESDDEALYALARTNAISLIKRIQETSDEKERETVKQQAEEMLGLAMRVEASIIRPGLIPKLIQGFRTGHFDHRSRLADLNQQIERNVAGDQFRARIILLASQALP